MIDLKIELSVGAVCSADVVNSLVGRCNERGKISDGYHTFDELYDHRIALYVALLMNKWEQMDGMSVDYVYREDIWRSRFHSDGSEIKGWFILGIFKNKGEQITYHLPMSKWDECDFAPELERAPEWDGHTSADVLKRLSSL